MTAKSGANATWSQYTIDEPRKRRAEVVCVICHSKKTKCDLQKRLDQGHDNCSYCSNNNRTCQMRAGKRQKRKQPEKEAVPAPQQSQLVTPATTDILTSFGDYENDRRLSEHAAVAKVDTFPALNEHTPRKLEDHAGGAMPRRADVAESHEGDIDVGFIQPFIQENRIDARAQASSTKPTGSMADFGQPVPPELLHIFIETYFDSCYAWCPVLDRSTVLEELKASPLLSNALAALGSNLRPPILPCEGPAVYYNRARRAFYEDEEPNELNCLRAVLLFYWWAPRATSLVHRHSSWWWTSVVIRHGQQMNLHRAQPDRNSSRLLVGLRRRIWWTAFARERLTALCQSKPVIINPDDCTVPEPTLEDFPAEMQHNLKAQVFIYWVRLCSILGNMAQFLSHPGAHSMSSNFQSLRRPAHDLAMWAHNLPPNLVLRISEEYTSSYNPDIHQLHLPYLTAVMVLHLKRAPSDGSIPLAEPPAIFAASCMARIFKDILARGDTRFLMAITSWHCGVSFLALLSASMNPFLRKAAQADMEIVRLMCDQCRRMWGSSGVVYQGIERLRASVDQGISNVSTVQSADHISPATNFGDQSINGSVTDHMGLPEDSPDWIDYFPFASARTSDLARLELELKAQTETTSIDVTTLSNYLSSDLQDYFFEGFSDAEFATLTNNGF